MSTPRRLVSIAALLTGCVPVVPLLPEPTAVEAADTSPLSMSERLGRWDGERFVDIEPGSLPPSHVHVLVHGWAPGWGGRAMADPALRSWEAEGFEPWVETLARAIAAADPHAVVVAYSWLDDAATSRSILAQRNAWARTELHGQMLALALDRATSEEFTAGAGRVQLIGHSYGARVAAVAAIHLRKAPQQLTIFDSPDSTITRMTGANARLADLLRKLPVGTARGDVFVDNYVSMVGSRYSHGVPGVVDVALAPPYSPFAYRNRHLYPIAFYERSGREDFGLGWSPLVSSAGLPSPGCYQQLYGEMELESGCAGLP